MFGFYYLFILDVLNSVFFEHVDVWLIFACELAAVGLSFKCSWKQTAFIGSGSYALQHFVTSFLAVFKKTLFTLIPEGDGWLALTRFLLIIISAGLFYGFHRIFIRWLLSHGGFDGFANIKDIQIILLSVITLFIVYLVSSLASVKGKDVYHNIYACCCCMLLLFLQFGIFAYGEENKKSATAKELLDQEHGQRRLAKETIEILNRKCHDLKHRIEGIQKIVEDEVLDGKLKQLYETARVYDTFSITGNSALDVLLTEKNLYCNKYGIRFTCIADGAIVSFMSDEDIYSLFGNALDNAIESVSGEEDDHRWISFNLHRKNGFALLHTDNYCSCYDALKFKNGLPLTTKSDGTRHGLGMTGMKYVVEKYGGTLSVGCEDNIFCLNAVIPLPEN